MLSLCQLVLNLRQLPVDMIGTSTYLHVNIPPNYCENTLSLSLTHACTHKPWQSLRKQHTIINYMRLHMHTSVRTDVAFTQIHHPLCLPKARCVCRYECHTKLGLGDTFEFFAYWSDMTDAFLAAHFSLQFAFKLTFFSSSNKETGLYFAGMPKTRD